MDTAEFKQQFLPYHRKLYRVAFRLTGNPQDAEDMVQEAYLKLWNKRDELADVLNTEAYCVTLIKNLCYDVLRRSQPDEDGRPPEELNLPMDTNIAREIEQRDEVNQVKRLGSYSLVHSAISGVLNCPHASLNGTHVPIHG